VTLTEFTALAGLVFGVIGAVLGVMSFMRDRVSLIVSLHWDWVVIDGYPGAPEHRVGVVRVQNTGRRPVFVSHVSIATGGRVKLLLKQSMQGVKLGEGDGPLVFEVRQEGLQEYARNWWLLRAEVQDAAGRTWRSPMLKGRPPSWASGADAI
jgi:hypothetical protein